MCLGCEKGNACVAFFYVRMQIEAPNPQRPLLRRMRLKQNATSWMRALMAGSDGTRVPDLQGSSRRPAGEPTRRMRDVSPSKTNPHRGRGRIRRSDALTGLPTALAIFALRPEWAEEPADILSRARSKSPAQGCQTGCDTPADSRKHPASLPAFIDTGEVCQRVPSPNGRGNKSVLPAMVFTPDGVLLHLPETVSSDLRL